MSRQNFIMMFIFSNLFLIPSVVVRAQQNQEIPALAYPHFQVTGRTDDDRSDHDKVSIKTLWLNVRKIT